MRNGELTGTTSALPQGGTLFLFAWGWCHDVHSPHFYRIIWSRAPQLSGAGGGGSDADGDDDGRVGAGGGDDGRVGAGGGGDERVEAEAKGDGGGNKGRKRQARRRRTMTAKKATGERQQWRSIRVWGGDDGRGGSGLGFLTPRSGKIFSSNSNANSTEE